jgi:hypothetical protein
VEGLCISPFHAALHAWNLKDGEVYDATWPAQHLNRYFGIRFSLEALQAFRRPIGGVFYAWDPMAEYLEKKAARR